MGSPCDLRYRCRETHMTDIIARIDALLANTPESEIEEFEVCRCLRDAKTEIERLREKFGMAAEMWVVAELKARAT